MSRPFLGFDHIDCRVRSLAAVESFYDALLPELGLPEKRYAHVDAGGDWHAPGEGRPANTAEYFEVKDGLRATFFMGLIERADHVPSLTRIAFRVERERFPELEALLRRIGAANVQPSEDMSGYPAIFFEDPAGTKLEIVARNP